MLDKNIPKYSVIMKCNKEKLTGLTDPILSEGFRFKSYENGDIDKWADIEKSVGEYDTVDAAKARFEKEFIPFGEEELNKRCYFILDSNNNYVATASGLYYNYDNKHCASLNWVAVKPEYQGKRLGRAIVQKVLTIYDKVEPNEDIYLKTQTWSHTAIRLYLSLGFHVLKTENLAHYINEYQEAIKILKDVMDEKTYNLLNNTAE